MKELNERIVQIRDKWFIETRTGFDGPFDDKKEAAEYSRLLKSCNAARCEFAGLQFSAT